MTKHDDAVALVGLGNMGSAVAGRLAERFTVLGFDVDPKRRADAAKRYGITVVEDLALLAPASTLVLSLPAPEISATDRTHGRRREMPERGPPRRTRARR